MASGSPLRCRRYGIVSGNSPCAKAHGTGRSVPRFALNRWSPAKVSQSELADVARQRPTTRADAHPSPRLSTSSSARESCTHLRLARTSASGVWIPRRLVRRHPAARPSDGIATPDGGHYGRKRHPDAVDEPWNASNPRSPSWKCAASNCASICVPCAVLTTQRRARSGRSSTPCVPGSRRSSGLRVRPAPSAAASRHCTRRSGCDDWRYRNKQGKPAWSSRVRQHVPVNDEVPDGTPVHTLVHTWRICVSLQL